MNERVVGDIRTEYDALKARQGDDYDDNARTLASWADIIAVRVPDMLNKDIFRACCIKTAAACIRAAEWIDRREDAKAIREAKEILTHYGLGQESQC